MDTAIIAAALVAGAAAGLREDAAQAAKDAYFAVKARLQAKYPQIDLGGIEAQPGSKAKEESLARDLADAGADGDPEIRQLIETLRLTVTSRRSVVSHHESRIRIKVGSMKRSQIALGPMTINYNSRQARLAMLGAAGVLLTAAFLWTVVSDTRSALGVVVPLRTGPHIGTLAANATPSNEPSALGLRVVRIADADPSQFVREEIDNNDNITQHGSRLSPSTFPISSQYGYHPVLATLSVSDDSDQPITPFGSVTLKSDRGTAYTPVAVEAPTVGVRYCCEGDSVCYGPSFSHATRECSDKASGDVYLDSAHAFYSRPRIIAQTTVPQYDRRSSEGGPPTPSPGLENDLGGVLLAHMTMRIDLVFLPAVTVKTSDLRAFFSTRYGDSPVPIQAAAHSPTLGGSMIPRGKAAVADYVQYSLSGVDNAFPVSAYNAYHRAHPLDAEYLRQYPDTYVGDFPGDRLDVGYRWVHATMSVTNDSEAIMSSSKLPEWYVVTDLGYELPCGGGMVENRFPDVPGTSGTFDCYVALSANAAHPRIVSTVGMWSLS